MRPSGDLWALLDAPWAILPEKYAEVREVYARWLAGGQVELEAAAQKLGRPLGSQPWGYQVVDGVAVLPIEGVISKRMNMLSDISGGTSSQLLQRDFQAALNDPAAHSILLTIDSPGGAVDGTEQTARMIRQARGTKPIIALADGLMASAAYWIGSAADKVYATGPTAQIGSIGVVATHTDLSRAQEMRGIKTTEIVAGKYKAFGSENGPLTNDARAELQRMVDGIFGQFRADVAANRAIPATRLEDVANGRLFFGTEAAEAGLIDGFASAAEIIAGLNERRARPAAKITGGKAMEAINQIQAAMPPAAGIAVDIEAEKATAYQQGFESGQARTEEMAAKARAEGFAAGAEAERARIAAVEAQAIPGCESLIAEMKADGKTTGPEAAVRVLQAVKAQQAGRLRDLRADAPQAVPAAEAPSGTAANANSADIARKAQELMARKKQEGITISAAEAVREITKEARLS